MKKKNQQKGKFRENSFFCYDFDVLNLKFLLYLKKNGLIFVFSFYQRQTKESVIRLLSLNIVTTVKVINYF